MNKAPDEPRRVAILFRSPPEELLRGGRGNDPHHSYYFVSLRDEARLQGGIAFTTAGRRAWHDAVEQRTAPMSGYLNYDHSLSWMRENRSLFESLFFLDASDPIELWFIGHVNSDLAPGGHGGPTAELRHLVYRGQQRRFGRPLIAARFERPEELTGLFWPGRLHSLQDSLVIAIERSDNALFQAFDLNEHEDPFEGVPNGAELSSCFRGVPHLEELWRYTIRLDISFFDVADPAYCLPHRLRNAYETHMRDILRDAGYTVHVTPLREGPVSDWIRFGRIPATVCDGRGSK